MLKRAHSSSEGPVGMCSKFVRIGEPTVNSHPSIRTSVPSLPFSLLLAPPTFSLSHTHVHTHLLLPSLSPSTMLQENQGRMSNTHRRIRPAKMTCVGACVGIGSPLQTPLQENQAGMPNTRMRARGTRYDALNTCQAIRVMIVVIKESGERMNSNWKGW